MPDKPTDKLTFVEWMVQEEEITIKCANNLIKIYIDDIITNGGRHKDCELGGCYLCGLEGRLSEYYKYFKTNK